jgi:hypothetical protein
MTHKLEKNKLRVDQEILAFENTQSAIFDAVQNSDLATVTRILIEKTNEVILIEDDTQMSSNYCYLK